MRITCDVEIVNRLLPSFNMRQKGKTMKSQVSIGRKPGATPADDIFLMICTKQDRNGAKYKLKENIQQCFTKFVGEGKATIRFSEPPNDVCFSKADPLELKSFLSVVKIGFQGKSLEKITLSSLAPASANVAEKLRTKLQISSRRDYPITTNFPNSLETLVVEHCNLKKFDSRMLQLRNLSVLNLSNNCLRNLPDSPDRAVRLSELLLAHNQIETIQKALCESSLTESLHTLDLTGNRIKIIKPWFCNLRNLCNLKLDHNEIVALPMLFGTLRRLRNFTASENKLQTLPATFRQLELETLDLFDNSFLEDGPATAINKLTFPSLMELTARAIYKKKIAYTEEDVGHLFTFLSQVKICLCGGACFGSFVHYLSKIELNQVTSTVVAVDTAGRTNAPCEAFLCSQKCYDRYLKNPNATIW